VAVWAAFLVAQDESETAIIIKTTELMTRFISSLSSTLPDHQANSFSNLHGQIFVMI
jgi:hypothetical protein